ncbi:hypothetical protein GALL_427170 [mine drainage metagenome]|uniref:Uncharacterized protein n=1 Tax=mine drainage metagenome TaxID=410659 RepID=A0A1J5PVX5_9ZZZZ
MPHPLQARGFCSAVELLCQAAGDFPRRIEAAFQQTFARQRNGQDDVGPGPARLQPARAEQVAEPAAQRRFGAEFHPQDKPVIRKAVIAQDQCALPHRGMQQARAANLTGGGNRQGALRTAWLRGEIAVLTGGAERFAAARVAVGAASGPQGTKSRRVQNR